MPWPSALCLRPSAEALGTLSDWQGPRRPVRTSWGRRAPAEAEMRRFADPASEIFVKLFLRAVGPLPTAAPPSRVPDPFWDPTRRAFGRTWDSRLRVFRPRCRRKEMNATAIATFVMLHFIPVLGTLHGLPTAAVCLWTGSDNSHSLSRGSVCTDDFEHPGAWAQTFCGTSLDFLESSFF